MKMIAIYEPALCCETGVCGVNVDSELLRISTVFNNLQKNGIAAVRFNLNSAPNAFIENSEINQLVNGEGVDALPATVVDGKIVKTKAYPSNEEIAELLGIPLNFLSETKGGCCGGSGGCC